MHSFGSVVPISFAIRNAAGALTNASVVTLTITLPDGATVTPSVANPPTDVGIYTYDYLSVQAGRHTWFAASTGPTATYGPIVFHVSTSSPGGIIGLDEAKQHLNITSTTNDEEIRIFLDAITPVVEDVVGPVVVKTYVEDHDSGPYLVLNRIPVLSITSVLPVLIGGLSYTVLDLDFDTDTGVLVRKNGLRFAGPLRVTYSAGRRVVPANITLGAKEILRHAWETQRGHSGARFGQDEDLMPTPSGFLIPHRAMGWLKPHALGPMAA